jgi:hypothetical protein
MFHGSVLLHTYGFPVELTEEIATQENLSIDMQTFEEEMQQQRDICDDRGFVHNIIPNKCAICGNLFQYFTLNLHRL